MFSEKLVDDDIAPTKCCSKKKINNFYFNSDYYHYFNWNCNTNLCIIKKK